MQSNRFKGYTSYSEDLLTCDLSASATLIFGKLASFARKDPEVRASNEYLERIGKCSPASVTRAIKDMVDRGLMTTNGSRNSRRFYLTEAGWALADAGGSEGEAAVAPAPLPTPVERAVETPAPAPKPKPKPKAEEKPKNPLAETQSFEQAMSWELPDFIPRDAWEGFIEMRWQDPKHKKASRSGFAVKGFVDDIARLRREGYDPRKLLEVATRRCWQGINETDAAKVGSGGMADSGRMMFGGRVVH